MKRSLVSYLAADLGSAVSVTLLFVALLVINGENVGLTISWFIALGVLGALFDVPGVTARQAMLPEIARAAGMKLDRASGINQSLVGASFLARAGGGQLRPAQPDAAGVGRRARSRRGARARAEIYERGLPRRLSAGRAAGGFVAQGAGAQVGATVSVVVWGACVGYALFAPALRELDPA